MHRRTVMAIAYDQPMHCKTGGAVVQMLWFVGVEQMPNMFWKKYIQI